MEEIKQKIDKIQEDIVDIKITLERNTVSLEEHIKRTALAEERVEQTRKELEPVKDHVKFVNWTLKIIAVSGTILISLKELGFFAWLISTIN